MNDCPNAETRDRLPDLLTEWLEPSARAQLMQHVEECVDCRDELDLLRDVRGVLLSHTPKIDIASVVQALPKAPVRSQTRDSRAIDARVVDIASRRRVWKDWRVAAAVTLLIAGGSSVAVYERSVALAGAPVAPVTALPAVQPTSETASNDVTPASAVAAAADQPAEADLGTDNRLGDLDEQQLQSLLGEIKDLRAVPLTEPEPVHIRVDAAVTASTSSETL